MDREGGRVEAEFSSGNHRYEDPWSQRPPTKGHKAECCNGHPAKHSSQGPMTGPQQNAACEKQEGCGHGDHTASVRFGGTFDAASIIRVSMELYVVSTFPGGL